MDNTVKEAAKWTESAAQSLYERFHSHCPFLRDKPKNTGDVFVNNFRKNSEMQMWIEWAHARDYNWWRKKQTSGHVNDFLPAQRERIAMQPVLERLLALGVPLYEVSSREYTGSTVGGRHRQMLDMVKFIEWARAMRWKRKLLGFAIDLIDFIQSLKSDEHIQRAG
jgi:hypothetical protein